MRSNESAVLLFDPRRLAQARRLRAILKSELAEAIEVTPGAISQYEAGLAKPTSANLAKIAFALRMPQTFFTRGRQMYSVAEEEANFRSLRSTSKRERSQARAQVELLAEVVDFFERFLRLPAVDVPALTGEDPERAAELMRERWGLGSGPITSVVGVLKRGGVIAARLPAGTEKVDAFSCWIDERPYLILASNKRARDRSRFDAAHELGHLVLHQDPQPGPGKAEVEGHQFASAFLMPRLALSAELSRRVDFGSLIDLKLRWGVSIQALLRRGRDLGIFSDAAYHRAMRTLSARGWRTNEPGDTGAPEQPELLPKANAMLEQRHGNAMNLLMTRTELPTNDVRSLLSMFGSDRPEVLAD